MNIIVTLPDGSEKTFSCSHFENVNGTLEITVGDVIQTFGQGEWTGWREVKNDNGI